MESRLRRLRNRDDGFLYGDVAREPKADVKASVENYFSDPWARYRKNSNTVRKPNAQKPKRVRLLKRISAAAIPIRVPMTNRMANRQQASYRDGSRLRAYNGRSHRQFSFW